MSQRQRQRQQQQQQQQQTNQMYMRVEKNTISTEMSACINIGKIKYTKYTVSFHLFHYNLYLFHIFSSKVRTKEASYTYLFSI
jgi:Tfp pilus assembly protein PilV